jgi:enoyl-CoA hydratase/carnithine racemase
VSTQGQWQQLDVRDTGSRVDITIARPDRRNSLDFETWDELGRVMADVAARDEVRVVTLTGEGDSFCAGVDFEWIERSTQIELHEYPSFIRRWSGVADAFERVAQPTIAAINGAAVGGGCELALACDLRIASDRAVFAMPQMRMGVVPDVGGTSRLAKAAGSALAKDMILTGRVIDAGEALQFGLVSRVVPHDDLARVADEMASTIESLPWPSAYFASFAIDVGALLDGRRAADLEAITDQVMFREPEVTRRIKEFMNTKGLKSAGRPA